MFRSLKIRLIFRLSNHYRTQMSANSQDKGSLAPKVNIMCEAPDSPLIVSVQEIGQINFFIT